MSKTSVDLFFLEPPQTGPLKDRSTRSHKRWKTHRCCRCCWIYTNTSLNSHAQHNTHPQQKKTPHIEYKSWQFGNWAFGLMELWRQPPEPHDRKRDLNKRAEYWSEPYCQGNITVKMLYKHRNTRKKLSSLPYLLSRVSVSHVSPVYELWENDKNKKYKNKYNKTLSSLRGNLGSSTQDSRCKFAFHQDYHPLSFLLSFSEGIISTVTTGVCLCVRMRRMRGLMGKRRRGLSLDLIPTKRTVCFTADDPRV